jgi:hypothetical protein
MAESTIEKIKLELNGVAWNEVEVSEYKNGRRRKYSYSDVPKSLVMKLLNASSAPSVSDFEGWLREYDAAEKKKHEAKSSNDPVDVSCGYWWART